MTSDKEEEEKLKIPPYVPGSAFDLVDLIGSSIETPSTIPTPTPNPTPAPSAQPKTIKQSVIDAMARRDIERDIRASLEGKGVTFTKRRDQTGRAEGKTPQYPEDLPRSYSSKGTPLKGPPRGPYLSPNFGSEGGDFPKLAIYNDPPESFVQRTMKNPITTGAANLAWQMAVGYYPYKLTQEYFEDKGLGFIPSSVLGAAATIPAVAAVEATIPNAMKGLEKIVNRYNPKTATEPSMKIQPKDSRETLRLAGEAASRSGRLWRQRAWESVLKQSKNPMFWALAAGIPAVIQGQQQQANYISDFMAERRAKEAMDRSLGKEKSKWDEILEPMMLQQLFGGFKPGTSGLGF